MRLLRLFPCFMVNAVVLAGCAPSGPGGTAVVPADQKPKVAVVSNNTADFWSICEAGAYKAGVDFNCDVVFRQPPTDAVSDQMNIVNDMVRKGVNGIAVSVINPTEQAPALNVISTKTNFITMDNDAQESGRKCYIGVNNYEAGKAAGRLVKQALPSGGTIALFIGNDTSANAVDRIGGVLDELAGAKGAPRAAGTDLGNGFQLHGIFTDGASQTVAQDKARDVLEKLRGTPNVCVVGLYAYNPKALVIAAKAKGLAGQVKIVGFDEDEVTLQGIREDVVVGTVVQNPFNYGYKSVEVLAALARGDASKAVDQTIPHRVITKSGGPTETHGAFEVKNLPVDEFAAQAKADLDSARSAK